MNYKRTRRTGRLKINILNLQDRLPVDRIKIREAIVKTFSLARIRKKGEITVCFLDDKTMRGLNLRHLRKNERTDVLSFSYKPENSREITLDIAVSTQRAADNAKVFSTAPLYEMYLYVVHGVLHALGYTDKDKLGRRIMEDKASKVLNALNITHAHT